MGSKMTDVSIKRGNLDTERHGNTCKPLAVSFQCMTKSTTNKKKKKKNKWSVDH